MTWLYPLQACCSLFSQPYFLGSCLVDMAATTIAKAAPPLLSLPVSTKLLRIHVDSLKLNPKRPYVKHRYGPMRAFRLRSGSKN